MRLPILFAFIISLLFLSCATDDSGESSSIDSTSDTIIVDDPVEAPINEQLKFINLSGITTLALKPRLTSSNSYGPQKSISGSIADNGTCDELGSITDDQYQELIVEGSTPCFSDVEFWESGAIYAKYYLKDSAESLSMINYSVSSPVVFSIITDASGDVHHLPGHPIKRNTFKNAKLIKSHQGKPVYINHNGKLVSFDLSTDTESILIDESITNFSIKEYSDGFHFVIDASAGVKRIKPDQSEEILSQITPGQYYDIDDSIQYLTLNYFKNMIFDSDGNITDTVGYSNPEEFDYWLVNGVTPSGSRGLPKGIPFFGSIPGCSENTVGGQRIMICNGKAFRIRGIFEDLEEIDWCDYGHCSLNSWATIKSCAASNYVYFYGESNYQGNRLTWINDSTSEFKDILETHQITDLECISDSELVIIGTIGELTETLTITDADTVLPVITVVDSQITDVITP